MLRPYWPATGPGACPVLADDFEAKTWARKGCDSLSAPPGPFPPSSWTRGTTEIHPGRRGPRVSRSVMRHSGPCRPGHRGRGGGPLSPLPAQGLLLRREAPAERWRDSLLSLCHRTRSCSIRFAQRVLPSSLQPASAPTDSVPRGGNGSSGMETMSLDLWTMGAGLPPPLRGANQHETCQW